MPNPSSTSVCATCLTDKNEKARSVIHPCLGCQQELCLEHLNIHRQELSQQFNRIGNQRQKLYDDILNNPNPSHDNLNVALEDVNRWCQRMHDMIDENTKQIRKTLLDDFQKQLTVNGIRQRCDQLTTDMDEKVVRDDFFENDIAEFQSRLDILKQQIEQILVTPQYKSLELINTATDDGLMNSQPSFSSTSSSLKEFHRSLSGEVTDQQTISLGDRMCLHMAASEQYLLAWIFSQDRQRGDLVLYSMSDGTELASTRMDLSRHDVRDIAYSESLKECFLIVCSQNIFMYNPQTRSLSSQTEIEAIESTKFSSIAVSSETNDIFLGIDYDTRIERWSIEQYARWSPIGRWQIRDILTESDHGIRMIRICDENQQVACSVLQQDFSWRIDLFDFNMQLIRRGERIPINCLSETSKFASRLALVKNQSGMVWLFTHLSSDSLWSIDNNRVAWGGSSIYTVYQVVTENGEKLLICSFREKPRSIDIYHSLF